MSDFCKQCSETAFGSDYGEHAGLITKQESDAGKVAVVICEGCGPTEVDHAGECVSADCSKGHGKLREAG